MDYDNKALVRRWFEEVWDKGRAEAIDEMFARDGLAHGLGEGGATLQGTDAFKAFHARFKGAFPDLRVHIEDLLSEGDLTATRFTCTGTHTGDQLGIAPTNRPVRFTGMTFARWKDGKITEGWNEVDLPGLMRQVGAG